MIRILNQYKFCYPPNAICNSVRQDVSSILFTRSKCYYASLGLDSNASTKDIKAAYYKLSLKFHPDKTDGCPEATKKFREITEAYETLGNPDKKKSYDENIRIRGPYQYDYQNDEFSRRSGEHYRRPPQTGKTKYYNYDEHFRQHYEEMMRQRAAENEYFKRRWQADRRTRYGDEHHWEYHYRPRSRTPLTLASLFQNKTFVYLMSFWILLFLSGFFIEDKDVADPKIYYSSKKVQEKNESAD